MELLERRKLLSESEPPEGASLLREGPASVLIFGEEKPKTMAKWRQRGKGPAYYKVIGAVLYDLDDLKEFLAASRVVPGAPKRGRRMRATNRS